MKFGDKIKKLRAENDMSQTQLAQKLGVSTRTIASYETGNSYPRRHSFYERMAEVFGVDVNYLLTENESFMSDVGNLYGARGQRQYERALAEVQKLFAGGELRPEDEIAFLQDVQQLYLDSKKRAGKYTRKDYLGKNDAEE